MSQFLTHILDDFLVHWGIVTLVFLFDCLIYENNLWFRYKTKSLHFPCSIGNLVWVVLCNQTLITFPALYLISHRTADTFSLLNIFWATLIHEVLFYHLHKFFHIPSMYRKIHWKHHIWSSPWALCATYAHPIEHAVVNIFPLLAPVWILDLSFIECRVWHILALCATLIVAHGGYKWARRESPHEIHHAERNCNYGAIGLLDYIYNT